MMKLVTFLSDNYSPRHYVVANTDNLSRDKVATAEQIRIQDGKNSQVVWQINESSETCMKMLSSIKPAVKVA